MTELNSHDGIEKAIEFSAKGKKYKMSSKLLDEKVIFDFIDDLLNVATKVRPKRREVIEQLMVEFPCSIPQAYRYYNNFMFKFESANVFDKRFLQTFIAEEAMIALNESYRQEKFDGKGAAMLLKIMLDVRKDWVDKPIEHEDLPIPVYVGDPRFLPNYNEEIESKLEEAIKLLKGKKGDAIAKGNNIQDIEHEELGFSLDFEGEEDAKTD